jgi:hypothetical protein
MSITDANSILLPAEAPWGVQFLNAVVHHTSAKGLVLITADERRFLGNAPARSVEPTVGQEHLISNKIPSSIADSYVDKRLSALHEPKWLDICHCSDVLVNSYRRICPLELLGVT